MAQWYVVYWTEGQDCEVDMPEVYQSADSYSDALVACNRLSGEMPSWYCEAWSEAEMEAALAQVERLLGVWRANPGTYKPVEPIEIVE